MGRLSRTQGSRPGRRGHEEEHVDELWLVSYADMMTLLFGFFVILFSFSTLDEKKFDQMTQKMGEVFDSTDAKKTSESDVGVSSETRQVRALQMLVAMLNLGDHVDEFVSKVEKSFAAGKDAEATKALVEKIAADDKGLVQSHRSPDNFHTIELVLPDASLFPSGGYRLTNNATEKLKTLANELRSVPNLAEIEVAGHTDAQAPTHNPLFDSNFTLSALRAGSVASTLIRFGVDDRKLTVRGMGSLKPLLPERDEQNRLILRNMAKNRRVTIILRVRNDNVPLAH